MTKGILPAISQAFSSLADTQAMKNLNTIKKIVEEGHFSEAHEALEDLLEMGPKNIEAIKLKAALFAHYGRFDDEEIAWRRVIEIDNEDEDAISYYQGAQQEDYNRYYFTDALPSGGRQYLTYEKPLIAVMQFFFLAVMSLLIFIYFGFKNFPQAAGEILAISVGVLSAAVVTVTYMYVKSLRSIRLTTDGMELRTLTRRFQYPWKEVESLTLAHSDDLDSGTLSLVVKPKDESMKTLSLNLTPAATSVMARRYFLSDVRSYFPTIGHEAMSRITVNPKKVVRF